MDFPVTSFIKVRKLPLFSNTLPQNKLKPYPHVLLVPLMKRQITAANLRENMKITEPLHPRQAYSALTCRRHRRRRRQGRAAMAADNPLACGAACAAVPVPSSRRAAAAADRRRTSTPPRYPSRRRSQSSGTRYLNQWIIVKHFFYVSITVRILLSAKGEKCRLMRQMDKVDVYWAFEFNGYDSA